MLRINMLMNIHKSTQWNVMFCFAQSLHKLFSCFPFSAIRIPQKSYLKSHKMDGKYLRNYLEKHILLLD